MIWFPAAPGRMLFCCKSSVCWRWPRVCPEGAAASGSSLPLGSLFFRDSAIGSASLDFSVCARSSLLAGSGLTFPGHWSVQAKGESTHCYWEDSKIFVRGTLLGPLCHLLLVLNSYARNFYSLKQVSFLKDL